jgi:hypothetical protein
MGGERGHFQKAAFPVTSAPTKTLTVKVAGRRRALAMRSALRQDSVDDRFNVRHLRGAGLGDWRLVVFNPASPQPSEAELRDRLANTVEQVAHRLEPTIAELHILLGPAESERDLQLAAPELRATITEATRQARHEIAKAEGGLDAWLTVAQDTRNGADLDAAANRWAPVADEVLEAIRVVAPLVQRIRKTIQETITLSDEERKAHDALLTWQQAHPEGPDLTWKVLRSILGDALTTGQLLARLAEKRCIGIRVQVFGE